MPAQKNPLGDSGLTVAANVARLRQQAGLSYVELERRLTTAGRKIPVLGLSHIEQGKRRVDADDLVALAAALGVNPNALLFPAVAEDEEALATATGETTGRDLWTWADGFVALPMQRDTADPEPHTVAYGRALWERIHGFTSRVRPSGPDLELFIFLAAVRRRALEAVARGDRVSLWDGEGYRLGHYPQEFYADGDPRGEAQERYFKDVLAILRSPSVAPVRRRIIAAIQKDLDDGND